MSGEKKRHHENKDNVPVDLPEDSLTSYNPMQSHASSILSDEIPVLPSDEPEEAHPLKTQIKSSGENLPCMAGDESEEDEDLEPYVLRSMVGKGGFGEVWEAVQVRMNRIVAVKRPRVDVVKKKLHSHKDTLNDLRLQFRQEALTTANLAHPNIIPVHDLERDENGEPMMVMKYIRGRPWDKLILEDVETLSVPDFLDKHLPILVQMAQATAFAHSRGVIHRDLKPSQIMVGEFGEVLLADWGLAVIYSPGKLSELEQCAKSDFLPTTKTASNPAGTPAFMAPEQTEQTAEEIGPWTDVYLLGGALYYLLSLKVPHRGVNAAESFLKARFGEVMPPQEVVETREIPEELADLAMRALTYDIEDRIQTVSDFLDQLKDIQTGAGRRRRSLQIAEEVTSSLENNKKTYSLIASCETRLDEATGLWGDNPEVPFLRRIVHTEGCNFALKNGDLAMARTHAESLDAGPHRDEALVKVAAAEAQSKTRERQRRLAIWGVFILAVGVVTIVSSYFQKISLERDKAVQAQERAFQARNDSQDLINFMLSDLIESLPADQSGPLKKLVDQTVVYYDKLPDEDHSYETLMQESSVLLLSAKLERELSNSDAALEKLGKQAEVAEALYHEEPDMTESISSVTLNYLFTSYVLRERGEKVQSELQILKALYTVADFLSRNAPEEDRQEWKIVGGRLAESTDVAELGEHGGGLLELVDYMTAWKDSDVRWANDMSFFFSQLGEVFLEDGYYEYAREAFHRAANIRYELLRSKDEVGKGWFLSVSRDYPSLMRSYISMGEVGVAEGNLELAIQDFKTAIQMSDEEIGDVRDRLEITRFANQARNLLSSAFYKSGQYTEALECSEDAVKKISAQSELDPANGLLKRDLAAAYRQAGRVYMAIDELDVARSYYQRAVPVALTNLRNDPHNKVLAEALTGLLTDYTGLARAYKEMDDLDSASSCLHKVIPMVLDDLRGNPNNEVLAEARTVFLTDYLNLAKVYNEKDDLDSAWSYFQKAVPIALGNLKIDPQNKGSVKVLAELLTDYLNLAKAYKEQDDLASAGKICDQVSVYIDDNDQGIPLEFSKERIEIGAMILGIRE